MYDLYPQIKPSIGLKNVSIAQDFLLKKIERRELKNFCKKNNTSSSTIYPMVIGKRPPSYNTIQALSHIIAPEKWFYTVETSIKGTIIKENKKAENICESLAFHQFLGINNKILKEYGVDYQFTRQMRNREKKTLIFSKMLFLKDLIPPQNWFIKY